MHGVKYSRFGNVAIQRQKCMCTRKWVRSWSKDEFHVWSKVELWFRNLLQFFCNFDDKIGRKQFFYWASSPGL